MKTMIILIALCMCSAMFSCASAPQPRTETTATATPGGADRFDFWLGEWELVWAKGAGTNSITRIFGGSVIQESFNDPGTGFTGGSMSTWRPTENRWRQVWMDNQGGYLEFVGGFDGEQMVLTLDNPEDTPKPESVTRMRWHDIEADRFIWTYEGSDDAGATWKTIWEINYTRRD